MLEDRLIEAVRHPLALGHGRADAHRVALGGNVQRLAVDLPNRLRAREQIGRQERGELARAKSCNYCTVPSAVRCLSQFPIHCSVVRP